MKLKKLNQLAALLFPLSLLSTSSFALPPVQGAAVGGLSTSTMVAMGVVGAVVATGVGLSASSSKSKAPRATTGTR